MRISIETNSDSIEKEGDEMAKDEKTLVIGRETKDGIPKQKFHVSIADKKNKLTRTFVIHDFTGKSSVDSIKKRMVLK